MLWQLMPKLSVRDGVVSKRSAALAAVLAYACGGDASRPDNREPVPSSPSVSVGEAGSASAPGPGLSPPTTPADGAGGVVGSATAPFGPGVPPPELARVEDDSPGPEPVNGTCPAGTQPVEPASCVSTEKRGGPRPAPCVCQYSCSPACGSGEVCAPEVVAGTACRCHAALDESDAGCTWTGLVPSTSFDEDAAWKVWTSGLASASSATVGAGELRLEVNARCAYVWAGTTARLPSRDQFPNGAALVLEYASNSRVADAGTPRLFLDGLLHVGLAPSNERVTERHCVQLQDAPRLASLYFDVETYGTCSEPLEYWLVIYDVRLEENAACL